MLRLENLSHSRKMGMIGGHIFLIAVLVLLGISTDPAPVHPLRAAPVLLAQAMAAPQAMLHVIVQKQPAAADVEAQVARLGGRVTRDLHIIHAFGADVPGRAMAQLAATSGVRWISADTPVVAAGCNAPCINTGNLKSSYPQTVRAKNVWNTSPGFRQGQGIGVAVLDSGITPHADLGNRVVANVTVGASTTVSDTYGHGTHVAGIIGGDGTASNGTYIGIAPKVNLVNVKISDDTGAASAADVVAGLQWVNDNKSTYNIRVVNLSLNSSVAESYNVDPIDAAVEILWFNKVVVVVSAGNDGKNALNPPANDPFVITVGAIDDKGTGGTSDDRMPAFSGYGTTSAGFAKPDLVAPGVNLISDLAGSQATLPTQHPDHLTSGFTGASAYFRMSGTSMAAPVVAGAVALLLQDEPNLTPDQVKYRLISTTHALAGAAGPGGGAGLLNIEAALKGSSTQNANTGIPASQMLWTGNEPVTWDSINWNSINWNSINWNSVNWNSINWNSINWNSDDWGP
ncbi:MAG TPA: S8 family peptidase [Chloroflexia bacterium]